MHVQALRFIWKYFKHIIDEHNYTAYDDDEFMIKIEINHNEKFA